MNEKPSRYQTSPHMKCPRVEIKGRLRNSWLRDLEPEIKKMVYS